MYLRVTADADGRLTLPAFAARSMGFAPGEAARIVLWMDGGAGSQCAMARVREDGAETVMEPCGKERGGSYTTQGGIINIPVKLLDDAGISARSDISVLSSEGIVLIAAADSEHQRDLTDELSCFLEEFGYDPERVDAAQSF
jgi:bifunctional DNA-binding transcriptional regulator/antitoxin component of YhaV-PrlF toxin-antitoxin module